MTSSGFVRAKSRSALAAAATSPLTNATPVGPTSSSSSALDAGFVGGEAHQRVLVDLVLAAAGRSCAAQRGELADGHARGTRSGRRRRRRRSARCTSATTATFSGLGFSMSPPLAATQGARCVHANTTRSERAVTVESASSGGPALGPLPVRADGPEVCRRATMSVVSWKSYRRSTVIASPVRPGGQTAAADLGGQAGTSSGRRRLMSILTPGPIVDATAIF